MSKGDENMFGIILSHATAFILGAFCMGTFCVQMQVKIMMTTYN